MDLRKQARTFCKEIATLTEAGSEHITIDCRGNSTGGGVQIGLRRLFLCLQKNYYICI